MKGWLGLTLYVALYDAWAGATGNPTLSRSFREYAQDHPMLLWGACVYMTAHLHGLIPARWDPLTAYTGAARRLGGIRTHDAGLRRTQLFH